MNELKVTHLGVYGVLSNNDSILLIKKSRGPFKGLWDLPGGKLEHGEVVFEGLKREFQEETKISITSGDLRTVLTNVVNFIDERGAVSMYHVGILYKINTFKPDTELQSEQFEDVEKAEWTPIHSIDKENLSPFARQALHLL